jgi:catechol-2,3-dioxygenase
MKILDLILNAGDLEGQERFYIAILGLRDLHHQAMFAVQVGETRLAFRAAPPGPEARYHFAFRVPPGRLEAAVHWLRERAPLLADLTGNQRFQSESWNADMVYFADPQGNILELIASRAEAPGQEVNPDRLAGDRDVDRPFSASEIEGIAEIGIATDTVTGSVAELVERVPGIAVFSGAGSDSFTAVGDAAARLIIVRRGRIWYPETGVPTDLLPLDVIIEADTGQRYRLLAPPYPFVVGV